MIIIKSIVSETLAWSNSSLVGIVICCGIGMAAYIGSAILNFYTNKN